MPQNNENGPDKENHNGSSWHSMGIDASKKRKQYIKLINETNASNQKNHNGVQTI